MLIVSQGHGAVDNVGERLMDENIAFIRLGSPGVEEKIGEGISDRDKRETYKNHFWLMRQSRINEYTAQKRSYAVLSTINGAMNEKEKFDVVIIEEAGRATPAETVRPLSLISGDGKLIAFGDHKQLRPYGLSGETEERIVEEAALRKYDEKEGRINMQEARQLAQDEVEKIFTAQRRRELRTSLFERAFMISKEFGIDLDTHTLRVNRRSHPVHVRALIRPFYEEDDITIQPRHEYEPALEDTLKLFDVRGREEAGLHTYFNLVEIAIVIREVQRILVKENHKFQYSPSDITVLSPFKAQNEMIILALSL